MALVVCALSEASASRQCFRAPRTFSCHLFRLGADERDTERSCGLAEASAPNRDLLVFLEASSAPCVAYDDGGALPPQSVSRRQFLRALRDSRWEEYHRCCIRARSTVRRASRSTVDRFVCRRRVVALENTRWICASRVGRLARGSLGRRVPSLSLRRASV